MIRLNMKQDQKSVVHLRTISHGTHTFFSICISLDNPIDRYCINDRSGLKANEDGSVDVILSKDAPEDTTNWLPVGDGGFHLYMRIYTPDMDALDTWTAPTITELDPANVN